MDVATNVTVQEMTPKNKGIVSCFVAKCTETVIAALLHSSFKDKYLQKFSDNNPVQREAIKAFLYGETHYVLPAIKHKDRVNFVRLYAVLCSTILDKKPLLQEAITEMYPKLPADSRLLSKVQSKAALQLFSVGVMANQPDYIDIALGKSKNGQTEEEQEDFIARFVEERMDRWRETYSFGFTELNPYACALLLYSSWCNDSAACVNTLEICRICSCISDEPTEIDLDKVNEIVERTSFDFNVSDYTKSIHSGVDLVKRIQNFYDVYTQVDTMMNKDLPAYSLSSINALWFADYLQPRSSIGLLFGKEAVTKEDRYLALRCALFQYRISVEMVEAVFQPDLKEFGDFTALSRLYHFSDVEAKLLDGHNILRDELNKQDATIVMERLRESTDDCIGAKFEETYLLTLYKILIERIIIRQECEELSAFFFERSSDNKEDEKNRHELEILYVRCNKQEETISSLKNRLDALQKKADDVSLYREKVERKNAIICALKSRVEALEGELARKTCATEKDEALSDNTIADTVSLLQKEPDITDEQVHLALQILCKQYTVALVDGHENFHRRLSEAQPDIRMLSGDDVQRKTNALNTADFVFCKSSAYGSHTAMEKAISATKGTSAHFILLSKITNIEQCEREIYFAILNCMSKEGKDNG